MLANMTFGVGGEAMGLQVSEQLLAEIWPTATDTEKAEGLRNMVIQGLVNASIPSITDKVEAAITRTE